VCLLSRFIDVYVPAEGFMDVQIQALCGVDVIQYLSMDDILGV
jgi:hypothetical protein